MNHRPCPTAQELRFAASLKAVEASVRVGSIDANDDGSADVAMLVTVAGVDHEVRYQRSSDDVLAIGLADTCGLLPFYRAIAAMCDEPVPDETDYRRWYYGQAPRPGLLISPAQNFATLVRQLLDRTAEAELALHDAEREAASHHVVMLHMPAARFADFDAVAADQGLGREAGLKRLIERALRNPALLGQPDEPSIDDLDVGEEPAPPVDRQDG